MLSAGTAIGRFAHRFALPDGLIRTVGRPTVVWPLTAAVALCAAGGLRAAMTPPDGVGTVDRGGSTFTVDLSLLSPSDPVARIAVVHNDTSTTRRFQLALGTTGSPAGLAVLRIRVDRCATSWTSAGTCPVAVRPVLTAGDVAIVGTIELGDLGGDESAYLRYLFTTGPGWQPGMAGAATGHIVAWAAV